MRLAWFSPVPPVKTGIAGRSADLVEVLRARGHTIDLYVDEPVAAIAADVRSAHEFVWRHARLPYDLTVYQFGNSSHHDYEWPYAFRYPGLVVLHDTHVHHARAALLLREARTAEYRAEFAFDEPAVDPDLAELAVMGFDSALYYGWPMTRALVSTARLVAVHGEAAAAELRAQLDDAPELRGAITSVQLGEGMAVLPAREEAARTDVRRRYGLASDAVLFGVFGGLTPEKRIDQILAAFAATVAAAPTARLLLAGAPAAHYDVHAAIDAHDLSDRVVVTGYLETDEELTDHIAACDVSLNLRWPTARETSGPWLRALAAARPTVIVDLVHLGHVPSLDPRTWTMNVPAGGAKGIAQPPICIAIDILDEDHSLRMAMRRLATDPSLRGALGRAAADWWSREHTLERMADDYERVMEEARRRSPPLIELPAHVRDRADGTLREVVERFGASVSERIRGL